MDRLRGRGNDREIVTVAKGDNSPKQEREWHSKYERFKD